MKLVDLNPCKAGLASARKSRTLRDAWDVASRHDLMWLIGKAHVVGTLSRRDMVLVAVRCVECVARLLDDKILPHLVTLSSWAQGADDVTGEDVRAARRALAADAYAAADDAYAAADDAYAAADTNAAADAASYAAYSADYAAADADVIRDAITLETVCSALGLDPDEVL